MSSAGDRHPDVIAPPPLIFGVPLLAGLVLDRVVRLPRLPGLLRPLGVPLVAAGLGMAGWFFTVMSRAETPIDPYRSPTALVTEGPFEITRNPAYVGMTLVYLGVSLATGSRWPLALLPGTLLAVDRGVVEPEEELLEERFGQPYRDYKTRVRRWL